MTQQNPRRLRRLVAALAATAGFGSLGGRAAPSTPEQLPAADDPTASNSDGGRLFRQVVLLLAQHAESRGNDYQVSGAQLRPDSESGGTPHSDCLLYTSPSPRDAS